MHPILAALRYLVSLPVRLYRLLISPLLPPSCIYSPTCSAYAVESIMRHGVAKGTILTVTRITRCVGALFDGGPDPVPEHFSFREALTGYRRHRRPKKRRRNDAN